jgi:hypothetical protein
VQAIKNYLVALVGDSLFQRVLLFLWGVLLGALAVYAASVLASEPGEYLLWSSGAVLAAIAALAIVLLVASLFGSEKWLDRAFGLLHPDDLVGIVLILSVAGLAIPLTAALRSLKRE